jgi:hypothetical protein
MQWGEIVSSAHVSVIDTLRSIIPDLNGHANAAISLVTAAAVLLHAAHQPITSHGLVPKTADLLRDALAAAIDQDVAQVCVAGLFALSGAGDLQGQHLVAKRHLPTDDIFFFCIDFQHFYILSKCLSKARSKGDTSAI